MFQGEPGPVLDGNPIRTRGHQLDETMMWLLITCPIAAANPSPGRGDSTSSDRP